MGVGAPSLSAGVLYPATLVFILLMVWGIYRTRSFLPLAFLILAVGVRYLAGAHHLFTFSSSPAGVSWNALISAGLFVLGAPFVFTEFRRLPLGLKAPVLGLLAVATLSALFNAQVAGLIEILIKYGFFLAITCAAVISVRAKGINAVVVGLLPALAVPYGFQILSVATGVAKKGESDGSASYIGGFYHEAAFSVTLATLLVVVLVSTLRGRYKLLAAGLGAVAITLANYRTTLVSFAFFIVVGLYMAMARRFSAGARPVVALVVGALGAPFAAMVLPTLGERLSAISVFFASAGVLKLSPELWSYSEQRLLSGRALIWRRYLDGYTEGGPFQWVFGFGPDSWTGAFRIYAHNTVVSYLYEFGASGAACVILLWSCMTILAFKVRDGRVRPALIAAHVSFVILNMSTMPHWQVEGLILYGLLCGLTIAMAGATYGDGNSDVIVRQA